MKEFLDNEGVCFGVDCIRSYSEIRKLTQASIQACDELLQVVRCRVKAEEVHAASLRDISQMPLSYSTGSLQDCMSQLQSDTKHKASQHQILADSLTEEVIKPISLLSEQMAKKEKALFGQYSSMQRELQQLEDAFKKKSAHFDKAYESALSDIAACRKQGISNEEFKQLTSVEASTPVGKDKEKGLAASWSSLASLTSTPSLLATKEKGKDWLNWAVASASGTPTGTPITLGSVAVTPLDKKGLCTATMKALQKLDSSRVSARKAWLNYVVVSQRYAIKTQILLTKLQGMQESFILILQDHLRKIVVVESSFLANQQYDIQMLFKVMEDIDVREDMRQFILRNASTPLDLYESDDEVEGSAEQESGLSRDRSASYDCDDQVEIAIDRAGKPVLTSKQKPAEGFLRESKKEVWDSPWTSDIFALSKLSHIRELPLPPCGDEMTFSVLKNVLVEQHLDKLDKESSSVAHPHQYLTMDRARALSRISLVSRHIDKHDSLAGEGSAGASLARLDITTSAQKKRPVKGNALSSIKASPSSRSPPVDDILSHPLTGASLDSPLTTHVDSPAKNLEGAEEDDEEDDEELMVYGTAEEALEKMVQLQTRMRQHWAALIEEFSEKGGGLPSSSSLTGVAKQGNALPAQRGVEGDLSGGVDEEKGSVSSEGSSSSGCGSSESHSESNSKNKNCISNSNDSSEGLDQLGGGGGGADLLSRSLKESERDKEENVDFVKCREIMNSFGLLDAVSIDVDDNWQESSGRSKLQGTLSPESSPHISPHSVQDFLSTPLQRTPFSRADNTTETLSMPFLATTKSDCDSASDSTSVATGGKLTSPGVHTPLNSYRNSLGSSAHDSAQGTYSLSHFGSATPESLDFLTS